MRATRRRNEYRRVQGAKRTALPFVRIEAPVGGWNTRDSEDNIPPTDALQFDNWWPDLGEVRTRPGYSTHADLTSITTGAELLSNTGFESAGGGGADVFANWSEATSGRTSSVSDETVNFHTGAHSAGLSAFGDGASYASIAQNIVTTASTAYVLSFWVFDLGTGTSELSYSIYDNTGSASIKTGNVVMTGAAGWTQRTITFTTPAGCISTEIKFIVGPFSSFTTAMYYVDDVSAKASAGSTSRVETLAEYISSGNRDLIAFSGGEAYNVTSGSSPTLLSGGAMAPFTNSRFQWVNFDGKIGFVNGAENLQWNGTSLTALTIDDGTGPPAAALTPVGVNVFKNRTWFWEENSQSVWYSALNTLGGSCTEFPLGRVGQFGGDLTLMETWTRDGGSGPDDFAVFVMSSGEALVYQGSYPGAAGDWALVGIYNIGEPLGYRSSVKYGGDLYIITKLDVVRMSEVLQGIEARPTETKIVPSHRVAVNLYGNNWGWEASLYPKGHMAIFNIPVSIDNVDQTDDKFEQHVQNTITGSWARFKGIISNTWQMFDGEMYIGSINGKVYKFDDTETDNEDPIESTFQTAWMPIGGTGANKLFKAVREAYKTNTNVTVNNMFATDFRAFAPQEFPVAVDEAGAVWDSSPWDTTPWSAGDTIYNEWESIGAYGERVSMRKRLNTKQRVTLLGYDWLVEAGNRL